jgi:hypothetical protein
MRRKTRTEKKEAKKKMPLFLVPALTLAFCLLAVFFAPAAFSGEVSFSLSPPVIDMGLNFNGAELAITGTAPAGSDIYLKIVSPPRKEKLNKKGRVAFFWMNVTQADVENIPKMYQIYSSAPISLLPPDLQKETGVDTGFSAVVRQAEITEKRGDRVSNLTGEEGKDYLDTLIGLYTKKGLYTVRENAVATRDEGEKRKFTLNVALPAETAHGTTTVTAYAVKDGRLAGESTGTFTARPAGIAGWVLRMAKLEGPVYGTFAVFIALLAGVAIDLLFTNIERLFRALLKKPAQKTADVSLETH